MDRGEGLGEGLEADRRGERFSRGARIRDLDCERRVLWEQCVSLDGPVRLEGEAGGKVSANQCQCTGASAPDDRDGIVEPLVDGRVSHEALAGRGGPDERGFAGAGQRDAGEATAGTGPATVVRRKIATASAPKSDDKRRGPRPAERSRIMASSV